MAKTKKHPGTIERRGDSHRVILYVQGERKTFTVPTADRKAAERFARTKHDELQAAAERVALGLPDLMAFTGIGADKCRERAPKDSDPVPAGFLDKYELDRVPLLAPATQKSYREILGRLREYFDRRHPGIRVDELRKAHVNDYLTWRKGRQFRAAAGGGQRGQASNRTVQKERATLHAAMEYALELELVEANVVHKVKPPKVDKRTPVLPDEDRYEALLSECGGDPMLALYALTLGETGERCESEALFLQWPDVRFPEKPGDPGAIWVEHGRNGKRTKSAKSRWVPMTPRLLAAMREHFARFRFASYGGKATPWIFHHTRTRRHAVAGQRITSLRRAFKAAAARAGLPEDFHQHDLRHRRVTTWLADEKSAVLVKEAVGHSDLRTTMGYTHLTGNHLWSLVAQPPTPPTPPEPERRQA